MPRTRTTCAPSSPRTHGQRNAGGRGVADNDSRRRGTRTEPFGDPSTRRRRLRRGRLREGGVASHPWPSLLRLGAASEPNLRLSRRAGQGQIWPTKPHSPRIGRIDIRQPTSEPEALAHTPAAASCAPSLRRLAGSGPRLRRPLYVAVPSRARELPPVQPHPEPSCSRPATSSPSCAVVADGPS